MSDLDHRLAKKTNRFNTEELLRIENDKRYSECLELADSKEDKTECAEEYPAAANRVKVAREEAEKKKKQQQQQQQQPAPPAAQVATPDPQTKSMFSNVLSGLKHAFSSKKKTKPSPATYSDFLKILLGSSAYTYDPNHPDPEKLKELKAVFETLEQKVQTQFTFSLNKSTFLKEVDNYNINNKESAKLFLHHMVYEQVKQDADNTRNTLNTDTQRMKEELETLKSEVSTLERQKQTAKDANKVLRNSIEALLEEDRIRDRENRNKQIASNEQRRQEEEAATAAAAAAKQKRQEDEERNQKEAAAAEQKRQEEEERKQKEAAEAAAAEQKRLEEEERLEAERKQKEAADAAAAEQKRQEEERKQKEAAEQKPLEEATRVSENPESDEERKEDPKLAKDMEELESLMSSDEELLSGGEDVLDKQVKRARKLIHRAATFIKKLQTQKSELEGEKIESERVCEEDLRRKDQAYQRKIIEKDDAKREAERQCGAEKTELEKQKKESDESHERKLAEARETCASEASNNEALSDALANLSDQLDTVLNPSLSGGEHPVDITPIIEKVGKVVNVVSVLKSENEQVQDQLALLQTQYNELQSQKQEDDATFDQTRAQLKEAELQAEHIRKEMNEEMESRLKEQTKALEKLEGEKIESERACEEQWREKDQAYQRVIIDKDDAIREAERQCGAEKTAELDKQKKESDETHEHAMNEVRAQNESIISEKDSVIASKDQACADRLTQERQALNQVQTQLVDTQQKLSNAEASEQANQNLLQRLTSQVTQAKEEAKQAKDENEVAGNHKASLEQQIADLENQLLQQQQQQQPSQSEEKLSDISVFETYGKEMIEYYMKNNTSGADKINYFVRYEKDFVRHLGVEKAMQYLKDFADVDISGDGSLNKDELAQAYKNTDSQQKATQAIQALGHDIDLRTYMKWRRGDFHAHGEIERHPEDYNTMPSDIENMKRVYNGTPGQAKINQFLEKEHALLSNLNESSTWFTEFSNLDTDKSGDLGEEEMKQAYAASCDGEEACTLEAHKKAVQAIESLKNSDGKIDLAGYIRWRRGDTPDAQMTMEDACQQIKEMYSDDPMCKNPRPTIQRLRADIDRKGISLAPEEVVTFAKEFRNLDEDGDGNLTVKELSAAYRHYGDSQVHSIQKAYEALKSKQGEIDLEDYILWKKTGSFQ